MVAVVQRVFGAFLPVVDAFVLLVPSVVAVVVHSVFDNASAVAAIALFLVIVVVVSADVFVDFCFPFAGQHYSSRRP